MFSKVSLESGIEEIAGQRDLDAFGKDHPKAESESGGSCFSASYHVQFVTRRQGNWLVRKIQTPEVSHGLFLLIILSDRYQ